jgi:plastocyanin
MGSGTDAERLDGTGRSRVPWLVLAGCALAFAVVAAWLVLTSGRAAAQQAEQGEIVDFEILVPDEPLTAGDSIEFTNNGERPHTVTDRGNTFDTDAVLPGDSASVTFDAPGTYFVFCRINPGQMNATVVVEEGPEPPEQVRIQAIDPAREGEELSFDPNELEVQAGTEVSVANVGGAQHTLTAEDGSFDTGVIAPGAEEGRFAGKNASFVVNEPGVFNFLCQIHPQAMRGTLTVTGAGGGGQPEAEPPPEEASAPGAVAEGEIAVQAVDLDIGDFFFEPPEAEVQPGAEVTWTNTGQAPHTATFDDVEGRIQDLDAGEMAPGESASIVAPDAPGSYSYFCAIHPAQMRAVLVVAAPADAGGGGGGAQSEAAPQSEPAAAPGNQQVATGPPASGGREFSSVVLWGGLAAVLAIGAGIVAVFLRPRPPSG